MCGKSLFCLQQLKEVKTLTKERAAAKGNDTNQIASIREDLDKLMKQSNTSPLSTELQLEMKNKKDELVSKLKMEGG